MLCRMGKQVAGSVAGRDRCRRLREFLQDVPEERLIGVRLPSDRWTRAISESRPIDGNGREGGCKLLSQGTHFGAARNRTERRKHEDYGAFAAALNSNVDRFTAPRPLHAI